MESTTTAFVGVRLVQRPSPATRAGDTPAPVFPSPSLLDRLFALLIQFPSSGGACRGPSKSEV